MDNLCGYFRNENVFKLYYFSEIFNNLSTPIKENI